MALGRLTRPNGILHRNLPSYRVDGSKIDGQEETFPADMASNTVQLINGSTERLHRSTGTI